MARIYMIACGLCFLNIWTDREGGGKEGQRESCIDALMHMHNLSGYRGLAAFLPSFVSSLLLYVHRDCTDIRDGEPKTSTSSFTSF